MFMWIDFLIITEPNSLHLNLYGLVDVVFPLNLFSNVLQNPEHLTTNEGPTILGPALYGTAV